MLIFLIGFMGCGKSYVGRNLAPLLGFDYIDVDKYIEEKEGLTIKEIFEQKGEDYFRQAEKDFIHQLDTGQNLVISTGGGAPCFFDNMEVMNEKGLTIYLNRNKEKVIWRLLKGQYKRPLIADLSPKELEAFYDERLESRKPFYEKAKLHVGDADVEEILEILKQNP
ncbi:MAG: AAA family ATPase [Sphingobacteriales bacterium]|nr:AAA family ATPase [Sphingobacteriales bacterium]MBP8192578.1 AAA family ATPase [Chitinophagales bacterium]